MSTKVNIVIRKDGTVNMEVSNAQGTSCEALTKGLKKALGIEENIDYKPEYYAEEDLETVDVCDG